MLAVFDANMLIWMLDDAIERPPVDPRTSQPVTDCKARIEHLFRSLSANRDQVVIPAPALAEALVRIDPAKQSAILAMLRRPGVLRVEPFGDVAAAECARLIRLRRSSGPLGDGTAGSRALVKFDLQIMAIANVVKASAIYSTDPHIAALGRQEGRTVIPVWDLDLPASATQGQMFEGEPNGEDEEA